MKFSSLTTRHFGSFFLGATILSSALAKDSGPVSGFSKTGVTIEIRDPDVEWGPCPGIDVDGCEMAVLNGDLTKPNADVYLKIPAKKSWPRHWHSSPQRMILVKGEMRLAYEGQETVTLKPGDYSFAPGGLARDAYCKSRTSCVLYIGFTGPMLSDQ